MRYTLHHLYSHLIWKLCHFIIASLSCVIILQFNMTLWGTNLSDCKAIMTDLMTGIHIWVDCCCSPRQVGVEVGVCHCIRSQPQQLRGTACPIEKMADGLTDSHLVSDTSSSFLTPTGLSPSLCTVKVCFLGKYIDTLHWKKTVFLPVWPCGVTDFDNIQKSFPSVCFSLCIRYTELSQNVMSQWREYMFSTEKG